MRKAQDIRMGLLQRTDHRIINFGVVPGCGFSIIKMVLPRRSNLPPLVMQADGHNKFITREEACDLLKMSRAQR